MGKFDSKENARLYEEEQKQRRYERMVRESKREVSTLEAGFGAAESPELQEGIAADLQQAKNKLRNRQKRLRDYCQEHGLYNDYSRTYTAGYNGKKNRTNISKTVDNSGKSGIIKLNRKVNRKTANIGAFANLKMPMQKRTVLSICKKYGIDTKGITFKIQRSEKMLGTDFFGSTDYDNIGRIDLFPNAFIDEEQLVRTILHEKCHYKQLIKYGNKYTQENLAEMEKRAYRFEELFYHLLKKRV